MVSAEIQSVKCSIPRDGAAVLTWNSDAGRPASPAAATRMKDEKVEPAPGREGGFVITAWALLSLGTAMIGAARLIPWWLFALVLLLILAYHP